MSGPPPSDEPDAPLEQLGPYRLERELARGGMGVVYLAVHQETGARVALKRLHVVLDSDALLRFRREAELLASIDHPHVVRVHTAQLAGPTPYLVQDLMPGGSLQDRLDRDGPLPLGETVALVRSLALALEHLHAREIVHRDLKPANVLFDDLGEPRLADFGLAVALDRERLTLTGEIMGTPAYMAPEQVRSGKSAGPPADVYGLSTILYAALTGRPPYPPGKLWQVIEAVLHTSPRPPSQLNPDASSRLDTVCLTGLAKEPADRYSTPLALAEALAEACQPTPRRRWPSVALTVAVLALAVLGGGLAATALRPETPERMEVPPTPAEGSGAAETALEQAARTLEQGKRLPPSLLEAIVATLLAEPATPLDSLPPGSPRTYLEGIALLARGELDALERLLADATAEPRFVLLRALHQVEVERSALPSEVYTQRAGAAFYEILSPDRLDDFLDLARLALSCPGSLTLRRWAANRAQGTVGMVLAAADARPNQAIPDLTRRIETIATVARELPGGNAAGARLITAGELSAYRLAGTPSDRLRAQVQALSWSDEEVEELPPLLRHPFLALRIAATDVSEEQRQRETEAAVFVLEGDLALLARNYPRVIRYTAELVLTRFHERWNDLSRDGLAPHQAWIERLGRLLELARASTLYRWRDDDAKTPDEVAYLRAELLFALTTQDLEGASQHALAVEDSETRTVVEAELLLLQGEAQEALDLLSAPQPSLRLGRIRPDHLTTRAHARHLAAPDRAKEHQDLIEAAEGEKQLHQQGLAPDKLRLALPWIPWRTSEATRALLREDGPWWPGRADPPRGQ